MIVELSWYIQGSSQSGPYERFVKSGKCDTRDLQGEVEHLIGKGYLVKIEAIDPPEEHPGQIRLEEATPKAASPTQEEKQPEGHWAACFCPICTGIRNRRYP